MSLTKSFSCARIAVVFILDAAAWRFGEIKHFYVGGLIKGQ